MVISNSIENYAKVQKSALVNEVWKYTAIMRSEFSKNNNFDTLNRITKVIHTKFGGTHTFTINEQDLTVDLTTYTNVMPNIKTLW